MTAHGAPSQQPGSTTESLVATGLRCYVPNYKPRGMIIDRGKGSRVWDLDGNEYIDLGTGISVNSLGHAHPALLEALEAQSRKLWHTSNIYFTEPTVRLAEELVQATFAERVFFCNSGAEAIEAAIKLARKYSSLHSAPEKREIITFEGSFHGRTLAAVTATAQPKYHEGFEPLPGGFRYCPFNDFGAVEAMMSANTCAVLVEPIQGEGGITAAAPGFLAHLRALCDRHGALLMLDEVQCGMGRTGMLFAHEWDQIAPDVMTVAKALGGGLPIGAMLAREEVAAALELGTHGSTFGGNPVACAVARAALAEIRSPALLANVRSRGEELMQRLERLGDDTGMLHEVRGRGLMIGAQLADAFAGQAGDIMERCRRHGVLILQAGPDVLRFLPPLNVTPGDLDAGVERVAAAMQAHAREAQT